MAATESIAVAFTGHRARSGPLNWSQRWIWDVLANLGPRASRLQTTLAVTVPAGRTLEQVTSALSTLIGRHEALRTRFALGKDGEPLQRVCGSGEVTVQVRRSSDASLADLADGFAKELAAAPFDLAQQLPFRVGLVVLAGAPRAVVIALAQVGFDGWSRMAIARELHAALTGLVEPSATQPAVDIMQPLDQVAFEQSPRGAAVSVAATEYWREQFHNVQAVQPPRRRLLADTPRFWRAEFRSHLVGQATASISRRLGVLPAAVLLSGLGTSLGLRLGQSTCSPQVVFHNRFRPSSQHAIGHLAQQVPIAFDFAGGSFADLVRRTSSRMLRGARFAAFDSRAVQSMIRGYGPHHSTDQFFPVVFNFDRQIAGLVGHETPEPEGAVESSLRWVDTADDGNHGCYINVYDPDDAYLMFWIDTSYLSRGDLADVALGAERLLTAAVDAEISLSDVGTVTDVRPALARSDAHGGGES